MKPRLLFISPQCLLPADAGGKIRTSDLLKGMLGAHFEIGLVMPEPIGSASLAAPALGHLCDRYWAWTERPAQHPLVRLLGLPSPVPITVQRDDYPPAHEAIARAMSEFDPQLVIYDFVHAHIFRRPHYRQASLCLTHNVEAEIFERHSRKAERASERLVWRIEAGKMKRFEKAALTSYDTVVAVSERDANAFRVQYGVRNVQDIPTGVDLDFFAYHPRQAASNGSHLVFVGAMDWRANLDGMGWFLEQVWPQIRAARPDARLTVVGKHPPESFRQAAQRAQGVTLTGWVEDVRPYVEAADLFVVPLRVGGGTRLKIYEAFSMGCPVVSTHVGAEGLAAKSGEHLIRADEPAALSAEIIRLMNSPEERKSLSDNARRLVEARFGHRVVASRFEQICIETLNHRSSAVSDGGRRMPA